MSDFYGSEGQISSDFVSIKEKQYKIWLNGGHGSFNEHVSILPRIPQ